MAKRNSRKKAVRKQHQLKMKEHDDRNDEEDSMEKEEEQPVQENDVSSDDDDGDDNDAGDDQGSNDDDSDNDSDDEEEDDMDVAAVFQGTSNGAHENDDDDSDDDDDDETEEAQTRAAATAAAASMNSEEYTFDMRNLLAISSDQLPMASLYNKDYKPTSNSAKPLTIPLDASQGLTVDEDYLLHCATAGCTQMIKALWQLPTDQSDAGPLVTLPGYEEIRLPRALVSSTSMGVGWLRCPSFASSCFLLAHISFSIISHSPHHRQREKQSGKSLPRPRVSLSTRRSDPERFGMRAPNLGCTDMATKRPTRRTSNGPLWRWVPTTTPTRTRGKSCARPSGPASNRTQSVA